MIVAFTQLECFFLSPKSHEISTLAVSFPNASLAKLPFKILSGGCPEAAKRAVNMDMVETQMQDQEDSQAAFSALSPIRPIQSLDELQALAGEEPAQDEGEEEGEEEETSDDEEVPDSDVVTIHDNICIEIPDEPKVEEESVPPAPMKPAEEAMEPADPHPTAPAPLPESRSSHPEPVAPEEPADGPGAKRGEGNEPLQEIEVKEFEQVQELIDSEQEETQDPNSSKGVFKVGPAVGLLWIMFRFNA